MTELFRRQAIDHQRQKFHGAIVLTRSPWQMTGAAFFVLLTLGLLVFAATQGFARKETVSGVLQPAAGVWRVVATQAGVVTQVAVAPGQRVQGGDLLVQLTAEQASGAGPTRQAVAQLLGQRQQALQDELRQHEAQTRQQLDAMATRLAGLQTAIDQQEHEIALQREKLQLTQAVAARYPALVISGAVSRVEADEKAAEAIEQQSRVATLERDRLNLRREFATLRAERDALPLQAGREHLQQRQGAMALAQQQAENEAQRDSRLLAPQAGQVALMLVSPGQTVAAGQTVATLLPPNAALEAELDLPTRAAGFVQPGSPVWLRVDAFPYARWGQLPGTVREVSRSVLPSAEPSRLSAPDAAYRVRVSLGTGPQQQALRARLQPGMQVQASIQAEKRTLLEWAFEPLAALQAAAQ